ncbi:MAG: hypothetical protein LBQ81_08585 [Zoogloeaceae bacterium]|jgi:hypothetical protein|nr:hypothetical protein [Zoogloeaceae bacterium]
MNSKKSLIAAIMLMAATGAAHAEPPSSPQATLARILACESIAESSKPAVVEKLIKDIGAQTDERAGKIAWYTLPDPIKVLGYEVTGIVASYGDKPWYIAVIKNVELQSVVQALKLESDKDGEEWVRVEGKRKIIVKGDDEELGLGCYL